jgi:hypothetical protein
MNIQSLAGRYTSLVGLALIIGMIAVLIMSLTGSAKPMKKKGIKGYEVVTSTATTTENGDGTTTATCSEGKKVLGGGIRTGGSHDDWEQSRILSPLALLVGPAR